MADPITENDGQRAFAHQLCKMLDVDPALTVSISLQLDGEGCSVEVVLLPEAHDIDPADGAELVARSGVMVWDPDELPGSMWDDDDVEDLIALRRWKGQVGERGGGCFTVYVERDTENYPSRGTIVDIFEVIE